MGPRVYAFGGNRIGASRRKEKWRAVFPARDAAALTLVETKLGQLASVWCGGNEMSKEAAAAILVQTLFTSDKSMQNLVMSHAKIGTAEPKDVVAFILPYYREMLKAMDSEHSEQGEEKNAVSGGRTQNSRDEDDSENETENKDERGSAKKAGA
jgi:hypothetical protein